MGGNAVRRCSRTYCWGERAACDQNPLYPFIKFPNKDFKDARPISLPPPFCCPGRAEVGRTEIIGFSEKVCISFGI